MIQSLKFRKWKKIIEKSGLFDIDYYLFTYPDIRLNDFDPISHYIKYGATEGRDPSEEFNTLWYLKKYPDVKKSALNPLVHYILFGQKENRSINNYKNAPAVKKVKKIKRVKKENIKPERKDETKLLNDKERLVYERLKDFDICWDNYYEVNKIKKENLSPMIHYIKNWKEKKPIVPKVFETALYLELYPEIGTRDINPLFHYLQHGEKEGRIGYIGKKDFIKKGKLPYSKDKECVVFVSHESSATGAPLLGYNIVDGLNKNYNVIHFVIKQSGIHEMFFNNCFLLVDDLESNPELLARYVFRKLLNQYEIKCVVCNSVVTFPVLKIASAFTIPTVSLIHEFSEYIRPEGRMVQTIFHANEIIVPATIIQDSMLKELKKKSGVDKIPSNISICPQGKLPFLPNSYGEELDRDDLLKRLDIEDIENTKVIVASGYVQMRKGVDIFASIARYIKKSYEGKCKFVWIGDGYDPSVDMGYSVWIQRELECYGLEDDFIFLEHQKTLDAVYSIADMFCLTSRLDPFPNVVIDALEQDLPIACFKDASGSLEFLEKNNAKYVAAEYLDTHQLAQEIVEFFNKDIKKDSTNKNLVKDKLDFDKYIDYLIEVMDRAVETQKSNNEIKDMLLEKKVFDYQFHGMTDKEEISALYYVSLSNKNLHKMNPNPKPGFSQKRWFAQNGSDKKVIPLYEAYKKGELMTHDCRIVPFEKMQSIDFLYAVHLHLYYTDLSDEFISYFKNLPGNFDLYITMVNEDEKKSVEKNFKKCGANNVYVKVVPNIGRDVGPMIFEINEDILSKNYEVIGHFHSKKSISTDNDLGNRWRNYLMDNLVGTKEVANSILSLFNEKEIGLVFAEDRHSMDIGENKIYLDELCDKMGIEKVDETALFPLGNMLWARVDAIRDLFELEKEGILQEEPLPYDGSFMHAIERVTPSLVEKNNYKYVTTYKRGTKW